MSIKDFGPVQSLMKFQSSLGKISDAHKNGKLYLMHVNEKGDVIEKSGLFAKFNFLGSKEKRVKELLDLVVEKNFSLMPDSSLVSDIKQVIGDRFKSEKSINTDLQALNKHCKVTFNDLSEKTDKSAFISINAEVRELMTLFNKLNREEQNYASGNTLEKLDRIYNSFKPEIEKKAKQLEKAGFSDEKVESYRESWLLDLDRAYNDEKRNIEKREKTIKDSDTSTSMMQSVKGFFRGLWKGASAISQVPEEEDLRKGAISRRNSKKAEIESKAKLILKEVKDFERKINSSGYSESTRSEILKKFEGRFGFNKSFQDLCIKEWSNSREMNPGAGAIPLSPVIVNAQNEIQAIEKRLLERVKKPDFNK